MLATKIIKKVLEEMMEWETCKGLRSILAAALLVSWRGMREGEMVRKGELLWKGQRPYRRREANGIVLGVSIYLGNAWCLLFINLILDKLFIILRIWRVSSKIHGKGPRLVGDFFTGIFYVHVCDGTGTHSSFMKIWVTAPHLFIYL